MSPVEGSALPQREKPASRLPHPPKITLPLPEKVMEPLAMGTLKRGILNDGINTGHSLPDAIRFLAESPELREKQIVVYTCVPASKRIISLNKKPLPYLGDHDNPRNIIITESAEEKFDKAGKLRFTPGDYVLVITMNENHNDIVDKVVLEVGDTYGNFISKTKGILENIPPNWIVFKRG